MRMLLVVFVRVNASVMFGFGFGSLVREGEDETEAEADCGGWFGLLLGRTSFFRWTSDRMNLAENAKVGFKRK